MSPSRPAASGPLIDVVLNTVDTSAPRQLAVAAATAEQAGFAGVWCYDHLSGVVLRGRRCVEVWAALAVTAAATSNVVIGPLVLNASVRHPAHVATAAASMQELCGERLHLGLGAGAGPESPYSRELAMFGLPALDAATRRARVRDVAGYLRALWAGATSYRGEHYGFEGVNGVELPRKPVPLLVAANGPRMAELAGEVADALNMHDWQDDLEGLVELARARGRTARGRARRDGGRPVRGCLARPSQPGPRAHDSPRRVAGDGALELLPRARVTGRRGEVPIGMIASNASIVLAMLALLLLASTGTTAGRCDGDTHHSRCRRRPTRTTSRAGCATWSIDGGRGPRHSPRRPCEGVALGAR